MSTKVFTVAGIIVQNGNTKVRFANDMVRRIKQFTKGGATRISFVDLPKEMNKIDALAHLKAHADFQSASDQATIADSLEDRVKDANKGKGTVKVKAVKAKPSIEAIKSRAKKPAVAAVAAPVVITADKATA